MENLNKTIEEIHYNLGLVCSEEPFGLVEEALITFNGKSYPKEDNVLLLVGGGGSGKGFILENLVGMEGKIINPDKYKELLFSTMRLKRRVGRDTGLELNSPDVMKDPSVVDQLHKWFKNNKIGEKTQSVLASTILSSKRKPNLIFDKTFKEIEDIMDVIDLARDLGYREENIHLVWVLTPTPEALKNNAGRGRKVPEVIIKRAHGKVFNAMEDFLEVHKELHFDGDIWVAYNSRESRDQKWKGGNSKGSGYIEDSTNLKLKSSGKDIIDYNFDKLVEGYRSPLL